MVEALQSRARDAVNSMETAQTIAGAGSERVKEAAEALHSMTQHVDRMSELNAETLKRMQSQVELGQNVSRGIDTISQHSLNTEACAEKTTAISKKLVTMANHLTTMVGKFRL